MNTAQWVRHGRYKGRDRNGHFLVLVKAFCSRLGMGNAECTSHEQHERRDDLFFGPLQGFLK
jgi:hypothetical protein